MHTNFFYLHPAALSAFSRVLKVSAHVEISGCPAPSAQVSASQTYASDLTCACLQSSQVSVKRIGGLKSPQIFELEY